MKQLTHLKDNLYGIEVPASSISHYINDSDDRVNYTWLHPKYGKCLDGQGILKADWKIIGTASKDNISFDPAPYIEKSTIYFPETFVVYRNYTEPISGTHKITGDFRQSDFAYSATAEQSFYSLLNSKGYCWENPMGEKPLCNPKCRCNEEAKFACQGDDTYWHEYEKKLLTGLILLIEKVK